MVILGVVIAAIVLAFAYWLYKMGLDILDVEEHFNAAVWAFFGLFIAAAIAMYAILPTPAKNANMGNLVGTWLHPVEAESDHLPLY